MDPTQIAAIAGFILALSLEYLPWFSKWYNALENNLQKLIVLGLGFVVVYGAFGLGCAGLIAPYWACSWLGAWSALLAFLAYLGVSQATYLVLPKRAK